jgi:hypothetical protein
MRVGVYVDGFNLYFGARAICGRGTPGWRWLDIRALAEGLLTPSWISLGARIERIVYCTARVSGAEDPSSPRDQDVYIRALRKHGSVDHVEFGAFVARVRTAPLAEWTAKGRPSIVAARWPVQVKDASGVDVPDARFVVSHLHREEKGSDVNVATHLLLDVLGGIVDGAVVITNDSDLALPLRVARDRIAVGTVNPGPNLLAGKLKGSPADGVGGHWWARPTEAHYRASQLPDPVGGLSRPQSW